MQARNAHSYELHIALCAKTKTNALQTKLKDKHKHCYLARHLVIVLFYINNTV